MTEPRAEFIDTYSDDMLFLSNLRRTVFTNPFELHLPVLANATIARIYAVMMVGNVESAIIEAFSRTNSSDLDRYLNHRVNNTEKLQALAHYLRQVYTGGGVDADILSDYLAIKYLRNGIIHSDRRVGEQATFVIGRGFPVDTRDLRLNHLQRMIEVNDGMTLYLGLAVILTSLTDRKSALAVAELSRITDINDLPSYDSPYGVNDFLKLHHRNLNAVSTCLSRLADRSTPTAATLDERIGTLVTEARADGPGNATYDQLEQWQETATHSWNQLTQLWPEPIGRRLVCDDEYRTEMLRIATSLAEDGAFPVAPLDAKLYAVIHAQNTFDNSVISSLFGGTSRFSSKTVLECYAVGRHAYELTAGIGARWSLVTLLDGGKDRGSRTPIASAVIDLTEFGRAWYSAIEHRAPHDGDSFERLRSVVAETSQQIA